MTSQRRHFVCLRALLAITILDAFLTCARKPTCVSLIYRTETTTKTTTSHRARGARLYACSLLMINTNNIITGFYTVSQKTRHQTLSHNFTNYYPIFEIFSLTDSVVNLQQTHV